MRRFLGFVAAAVVGYALLPGLAQAQVVVVPGRVVYSSPPVIVTPAPSYYVAPSITAYSAPATYSYYPPTVTYSSPAPVVTYSAPPSVVTYSAPAPVLVPAGHVEYTTSYGFGIFRPRGWTTEVRYRP